MTELQLENVTKVFGDDGGVVAVDEVSVRIPDGEFLVLVGPSGCGKSTTLRMVAGLEDISDGEIRLGSRRLNDVPPQERDIAMVFQSYALYPHMTVAENMAFGLEESTTLPGDEIRERVEHAADIMGISELLDRRPSDLSGGQQQRVALGRAIVRDPDVFLMDEPLSNLDAKLRADMRTELQQLQADLDVTTVYVTHDQTEAMTMGDRIAVLDDGELQQVGTPLECYHEPNNRFVAGFVGEPSMNFFEMDVEDGDLVSGELRYELSPERRDRLGGARRVTFGIRPENVGVGESGSSRHEFDAEIQVVEPRGDENTVHLRFLEENFEQSFTATTDGMTAVESGERVTVRLPEDAVHVFDADNGRALFNRRIDDADEVDLRT